MKNNKTIYHFVVDQSGSMSGSESATIEGFNSQLKTLKSLKKEHTDHEYVVSVTYFEDEVMDILNFAPIEEVQLLSRENYKPGGLTALLDGIGKSIERIQDRYAAELNADQATVVMIILTDGGENASKFYTHNLIASRIKTLDETGKWTFSFLGADLDAVRASDQLNIRRENIISFNKSNYADMMDQVSDSIRSYEHMKSMGNYKNDLFDEISEKDQRDLPL
jgi:uncharacterized protein YegL